MRLPLSDAEPVIDGEAPAERDGVWGGAAEALSVRLGEGVPEAVPVDDAVAVPVGVPEAL